MWIAKLSVATNSGVEHIYERAVTIGRIWTLLHKHLFDRILEISIYQEEEP